MLGAMAEATYELLYWPFIPGRGERVRLAFEDAGVDYDDVCRRPEAGVKALTKVLASNTRQPAFAPPILRHGELLLAQTSAILHYLGPRLGLVPGDEGARAFALQLELTLADLVTEVHDVHHPVGSGLYYEDQKTEALRAAKELREKRLPKFLGYFERVLENNGGAHLLGVFSYCDLSMFQVLSGLHYAFPKAMARLQADHPRLAALRERVAARPRIAAYRASPRCLPFNEQGIFRHYPELDD